MSAPVLAGIADSPLPLLNGVKSQLLHSVPGVVKLGLFETLFMCTSAETEKTIRIAVEVFDDEGGSPENEAVGTARAARQRAPVAGHCSSFGL